MRGQCVVLNTILSVSSFSTLLLLLSLHLNPKTDLINPLSQINLLSQVPVRQNFSLLIGVLTRPDYYDRHHFLRMVYGVQKIPSDVKIHIRFVFCRLTNDEQRTLIALEILRYNDIIILSCTENMNDGKTYSFFSSLPNILSEQYDYVMKADDDSFVRLEALSSSLSKLERNDLYYGFVLPCTSSNPYSGHMSGMGFVLSWDLVQWISVSDIPFEYQVGIEDKLVEQWLTMGKRGKNRVAEKPGMYDYPGTNSKCSHDLIPDTVAIHRLKRWDRWFMVLRYFNMTRVPSSKMYLI